MIQLLEIAHHLHLPRFRYLMEGVIMGSVSSAALVGKPFLIMWMMQHRKE